MIFYFFFTQFWEDFILLSNFHYSNSLELKRLEKKKNFSALEENKLLNYLYKKGLLGNQSDFLIQDGIAIRIFV
jgi:hypothetical protein